MLGFWGKASPMKPGSLGLWSQLGNLATWQFLSSPPSPGRQKDEQLWDGGPLGWCQAARGALASQKWGSPMLCPVEASPCITTGKGPILDVLGTSSLHGEQRASWAIGTTRAPVQGWFWQPPPRGWFSWAESQLEERPPCPSGNRPALLRSAGGWISALLLCCRAPGSNGGPGTGWGCRTQSPQRLR